MGCPLSLDNKFDCANQRQGGIKSRLALYNKEDWDAGAVTEGVDGTITNFVNAVGKKAYDYSVADEGNIQPNCALRVVEGGADAFDHSIVTVGFDISQAGADEIAKMRFQKVVAVFERLDGTAKVYGRNVGMRLSDFQFNEGSSDLGGVIQFTLATPANGAGEIGQPTVIDAGDAATTKAVIDGMFVVGV